MPRKFFKRILPDPQRIKDQRFLKFLGSRIHDSDLWHLTKNSVARAFFIGIFCALQPLPLQTVPAAVLAIIFRCNLPLAVALVFITNPLTMGPVYYFNYWIGTLLLGAPVERSELQIQDLWSWLLVHFKDIGAPLVLGSLVSGLVFATLSYFAIQWIWIWHVTDRWRKRADRRKRLP